MPTWQAASFGEDAYRRIFGTAVDAAAAESRR
jgi:hypothetical protein